MATKLNFAKDVQGYNAYAPMPSNTKYSATLSSGSAQSITVPKSEANWIAVFSYQPGTDCWVDFSGAAATLPAGSSFAATTSELLPAARLVAGGSNISVITANTTADVGVMLYAIPFP